MRSRSTIFALMLLFAVLTGSTSCDLINPEEQIPSFLCIDSIGFDPGDHGSTSNDIVDAWVFDNEQLVGVYEMPAVVPILNSGETNIRIRPGVKLNGQAATRWKYLFLEDFVGTVELFEDSTVCVNPTLTYKDNVLTPWEEDFESGQQPTLTNSNISQGALTFVSDANAYDGKSAKLHLPSGADLFECQSTVATDLPGSGASVVLEFQYKCAQSFRVSLISQGLGSIIQTPIYVVSPSEEWKYIYISLTDVVSSLIGFNDHKPAFGFVREEGMDGDIDIYLDNIRLIHFDE